MNWANIIQDLQTAGLSQAEIAKHCDCSQGLISQIKNSQKLYKSSRSRKAISFDLGTSLIELHSQHMQQK
jgi:transcriptional regulator with XRE-family HTH domain